MDPNGSRYGSQYGSWYGSWYDPSGSFLGILQLYNNHLGPPGTLGVFQKVLENIQKLLQLHKKYLGPPGT